MIWATVNSRSCFCWVYRASPSLAAKNIISRILVLNNWWRPCVESSLVLLVEGVCYKRCRFSSLGGEDPLEEGMATQSSILAWRISWIEEPDRLQSIGSQRAGHDWSDLVYTHKQKHIHRGHSTVYGTCLVLKIDEKALLLSKASPSTCSGLHPLLPLFHLPHLFPL